MGKHSEWRKVAKKLRRKRLRQCRAQKRDAELREEQEKLARLPEYEKWLQDQEKEEEERAKEEATQAIQREKHWREVEEIAQKQWQELQKKFAQAREEKMKQNMKIKLEWEREQKRLKEIQIAKEKELEEQRLLQQKLEKELLDFLEEGGDTPEHLKSVLETNPGRDVCPFFQKVSACRFFDSCSRNHIRPSSSQTLLITNFFSHISLDFKENEHGSDSSLEFETEDTYKYYIEFFNDVVLELEKCGRIRKFITCCNHEAHLRGNVYVEYQCTREALIAYHKFNGRWYAGKQLNVQFCSIHNWNIAICGLFYQNRCPKGNMCNFLHPFRNPKGLYTYFTNSSFDRSNYSSRSQSRSVRRDDSPDGWDSRISNKRNWRWSESPEPPSRKRDETPSRSRDRKDSPIRRRTSERRNHFRRTDSRHRNRSHHRKYSSRRRSRS